MKKRNNIWCLSARPLNSLFKIFPQNSPFIITFIQIFPKDVYLCLIFYGILNAKVLLQNFLSHFLWSHPINFEIEKNDIGLHEHTVILEKKNPQEIAPAGKKNQIYSICIKKSYGQTYYDILRETHSTFEWYQSGYLRSQKITLKN